MSEEREFQADDAERLAAFAENATAPKRVQTDSGSVEQHPIADQIKALEFLKKEASGKKSQLARVGFYQIAHRG